MAQTKTTGTGSASDSSTIQSAIDTGRDYLDSAVSAAKERPVAAAAIGVGVIATVAAGAYGASQLLKQRATADGSPTFDADTMPESITTQ